MIEVYASPTANCQRVTIALAVLGLPHRVVAVDRAAGEQRSEAFLAINPAAAVPAIIDRDPALPAPVVLAQSGAILIYLAEKSGRLLPHEGAARALTFQWLMQALTDANAAASLVFMARHGIIPGAGAEVQGFLDARLARFLGDADRVLATRDHLAGELSIADLALYPVVAHRWRDAEVATRHPYLAAWAERIAARPEVAAILPIVR
ncbi:glutathione S-transferase family protein [Roseomonas fluvialis]|uniref:Thiol:disulfide oxidoreductase n=1 Tax=Roseomonas fluvialis TaxID=1750527 RepID=A0ABM7Y898_9PROT|nr:glutathione S-transferase family protein [Roseomonas fluvialis]BDG74236.1 thiol:disulfide oxidoreductase [Roseomonas fluvialis]